MKSKIGNSLILFPTWWPSEGNELDGNFFMDQILALKEVYKKPIIVVLFSEQTKDWLTNDELEFIKIIPNKIVPAKLGKWAEKLKRKYLIHYFNKKVDSALVKGGYKPELALVQSVLSNAFLHYNFLKARNLPYFIIEHYVTFHKVEHYMYKPYSNIVEIKRFVKDAAKRFGVSQVYSEIYSNYFESNFTHLYNPINSIFFNQEVAVRKSKVFTFINIGGEANLRKRPYLILNALNKAFSDKVRLIFVAKDQMKSELIKYATKINFKHELEFYPKLLQSEIIKLLDESNVLISASEYESFGLTIIEANARGLPVVCSRSGGPQNIVTQETGRLFDVDDLDGFVQALREVRNKYNNFEKTAIRAYAENNFSEIVYANNLLKEIKETLEK